jgi:thiamin-phosphate kinase
MDTRGQGSAWGGGGGTADPQGGAPAYPGFMTRGIDAPENYYYRRVFTDGVRAVEAARSHPLTDPARTVVLGGNLSDASELSIVTTVLGSAYEPLRRSGARSGDGVYVTGTLGGPGRAIAALAAGREADVPARASFAHPTPRIREALWLADRGASAAIDISDGLAADLAHLAAASEVTIDIDVERIQTIDGADWRNALASGEEYELVVTSPRELDCGEFARVFGLPLTRIGVVTAGDSASSVVLRANGERVANPPGHDHFS